MKQSKEAFTVDSMCVYVEKMPDEYCSNHKLQALVHDNVWACGSGDTPEECVASLVACIRKSADAIEKRFKELSQ